MLDLGFVLDHLIVSDTVLEIPEKGEYFDVLFFLQTLIFIAFF